MLISLSQVKASVSVSSAHLTWHITQDMERLLEGDEERAVMERSEFHIDIEEERLLIYNRVGMKGDIYRWLNPPICFWVLEYWKRQIWEQEKQRKKNKKTWD